MQLPTSDTALLVFTRTAAAESLVKSFVHSKLKSRNRKIASLLIERAKGLAKQSHLPYFIYTESQQQGYTFGERITNAVNAVFQKGFSKVIVIGNDCIQLNHSVIHSAVQQLKSFQQVLIPTANGGISLIGIQQSAFNASNFSKINWQTNTVFIELKDEANRSNKSTVCLPVLNDVNSYEDLLAELKQLPRKDSFYITITAILSSVINAVGNAVNDISKSFVYTYILRGPPAFKFN